MNSTIDTENGDYQTAENAGAATLCRRLFEWVLIVLTLCMGFVGIVAGAVIKALLALIAGAFRLASLSWWRTRSNEANRND